MHISAGRRRAGEPAIEQVARITRRLAVLLAAGVTPGSAWGYLSEVDDPSAGEATGAHDVGALSGEKALGTVADSTVVNGTVADSTAVNSTVVDGTVTVGGPVGRATGDPVLDDIVMGSVIDASVQAHAAGLSIPDALVASSMNAQSTPGAQSAWHSLAAAWSVAVEAGAPLADCLHRLADSFDEHGSRQRELEVALAGPAATARMVMWLPAVGILFGAGLGFDTLGVLFASAPGVLCLVLGASLMLLGARWNRAMIRAARPRDTTPGLIVELTAIAMAGGGSIDRASTLAAAATHHFLPADAASGRSPEQAERERAVVGRVLALSTRAGVPAAQLLRAEAAQLRRQANYDGQKAVATVAVRLMLPLGLCVLPAFMLLGVAPLLMAVLSSTIADF